MDLLNGVKLAFPEIRVPSDDEEFRKLLGWLDIYKGEPSWRFVKRSGLYARGERKMSLLNVAKTLADEFSALTFSEQVDISISNSEYQGYVDKILNENGFWRKVPSLLSFSYGVGRGVFKLYIENSRPKIDFVRGNMFIPCGFDNKGITEGIFCSESFKNGFYYKLFERHFTENGYSAVEFRLFKSRQKSAVGEECEISEMYKNLPKKTVYSGVEQQMFQCFSPFGSREDNLFGAPIFAGAEDTLKALDIAFDSLSREFVLGKKRIIVPSACIRTVVDPESGKMRKYFDADDEAFVALKAEENEELKISDNTVELRVDEQIKAIDALLGILCFQVGLSASTAAFSEQRGVKTATEVISEDSRSARTIRANKNILTEVLTGVVQGIISLGVLLGEIKEVPYTVNILWNDGIITDDNTKIENNIRLVNAGLKSKERAIMDIFGCDEESAIKEIKRIGEV